MFKKVFAATLTALMIVSMCAIHAFGGALNPDNGCKVEAQIKRAAPGAVVHDGVITPGEYNEIEINRNSDTTDMLITWNGSGELITKACEFLNNVHFFASWDENGVNFAAQATLLEDPHCEGTYPATMHEEDGKQFMGDEFFMFQFGCVFKIENPDDWDREYLYRSLGMNTETGEILVGSYWADGHTGALPLSEGEDYYVGINGRTVTYEITFPIDSVLKSNQISGSLPIEGSNFYFTISLTGGSEGHNFEESATYAVSLGDGGYMTTRRVIGDYSGALGIISNDPVVEEDVPVPTDTEETTAPVDTNEPDDTTAGPNESTPPEETQDPYESEDPVSSGEPVDTDDVPGTEDPAQSTGENPADPTDSAENPGAGTDTPRGGTGSPKTGDPMIIFAVISAVGATGAVIIRRRKS